VNRKARRLQPGYAEETLRLLLACQCLDCGSNGNFVVRVRQAEGRVGGPSRCRMNTSAHTQTRDMSTCMTEAGTTYD